jgi:hypothetical protein
MTPPLKPLVAARTLFIGLAPSEVSRRLGVSWRGPAIRAARGSAPLVSIGPEGGIDESMPQDLARTNPDGRDWCLHRRVKPVQALRTLDRRRWFRVIVDCYGAETGGKFRGSATRTAEEDGSFPWSTRRTTSDRS